MSCHDFMSHYTQPLKRKGAGAVLKKRCSSAAGAIGVKTESSGAGTMRFLQWLPNSGCNSKTVCSVLSAGTHCIMKRLFRLLLHSFNIAEVHNLQGVTLAYLVQYRICVVWSHSKVQIVKIQFSSLYNYNLCLV